MPQNPENGDVEAYNFTLRDIGMREQQKKLRKAILKHAYGFILFCWTWIPDRLFSAVRLWKIQMKNTEITIIRSAMRRQHLSKSMPGENLRGSGHTAHSSWKCPWTACKNKIFLTVAGMTEKVSLTISYAAIILIIRSLSWERISRKPCVRERAGRMIKACDAWSGKRANSMKTEFSPTLPSDMRTPFNAVIWLCGSWRRWRITRGDQGLPVQN